MELCKHPTKKGGRFRIRLLGGSKTAPLKKSCVKIVGKRLLRKYKRDVAVVQKKINGKWQDYRLLEDFR